MTLRNEIRDAINTPESKRSGEVWVNVLWIEDKPHYYLYGDREMADRCAGLNRIACFLHHWTEGEGLEGE